jgi:hypothetical protein
MKGWLRPRRCLGRLPLLKWLLCAALLVSGCGGSHENPLSPVGNASVPATLVGSASAVVSGPPGAYFISEDRKQFHLRCPCGVCSKSNVLPLVADGSPYVWTLSGEPERPTLSPSIHWFETDGRTTHWHGWLQNGSFNRI